MPLPDGLRHSRIPRQEPVPLTVDGLRFAIFYTKLHDRMPRPLLATSHQRHRGREKNCEPPTITPMSRSTRQLEDVVGRHLVRFGERDELTVRWESIRPPRLPLIVNKFRAPMSPARS
jgi:hypothetical protein